MTKRTPEEIKAYVDGYNACYKQFCEILADRRLNLQQKIDRMKLFVSAVNGVAESEE